MAETIIKIDRHRIRRKRVFAPGSPSVYVVTRGDKDAPIFVATFAVADDARAFVIQRAVEALVDKGVPPDVFVEWMKVIAHDANDQIKEASK